MAFQFRDIVMHRLNGESLRLLHHINPKKLREQELTSHYANTLQSPVLIKHDRIVVPLVFHMSSMLRCW